MWPAPAKLNLFLHVTGRRADGYHTLQTVFQFIDYCDELRFEVRQDGVLHDLNPLPGVAAADNLMLRAARLLQTHSGTRLGADIHLTKRLPLGGGLGGGSSDAATTLVALNVLWGLGLPRDELAALGLTLGADVPVFVHGQAAWAEGVGERLTPVSLAEPWYVVIIPPCQVSTAAIFAAPDLTRDTPPITIRDFLAGLSTNDCQGPVTQRYPEVAAALAWLGSVCPPGVTPCMTGTGACLFAAFQAERDARRVLQRFSQEHPPPWHGLVAQGLNLSPLHRAAESIGAKIA